MPASRDRSHEWRRRTDQRRSAERAHRTRTRTHRRSCRSRPSSREAGFDLATAYAVEAELARLRRPAAIRPSVERSASPTRRCGACSSSTRSCGRTCTTTRCITRTGTTASLSLGRWSRRRSNLKSSSSFATPAGAASLDAAAVLGVGRMAGARVRDHRLRVRRLEVSACRFRRGLRPPRRARCRRATPGDRRQHSVARRAVGAVQSPSLQERRAGRRGSGRNSLRSPALCLGELASAISDRSPEEPLAGGELVSSGTLTESQPIVPGETWTATLEGIELSDLTLTTTA